MFKVKCQKVLGRKEAQTASTWHPTPEFGDKITHIYTKRYDLI